jgi:hypothetical protein
MSLGELKRRLSALRRRLAALLAGDDTRPPAGEEARLQRLERRVAHLESLVEGLQDGVHTASVRHEERMAELERKTEPDAIAKALSNDARRRGI